MTPVSECSFVYNQEDGRGAAVMLHMLQYIPGVQRVYDEAVGIVGYPLVYPLYKFKTQEICIKAAVVDP